MKCQCCNKNEAEQRLHINILGQAADIGLCASCVRRLKVYVAGMMDAMRLSELTDEGELYIIRRAENAFPGKDVFLGKDDAPEKDPFPGGDGAPDAGDQIKLRRRLNELRQQMKDAVAAEDYEAAATLRDEIETEHDKGIKI